MLGRHDRTDLLASWCVVEVSRKGIPRRGTKGAISFG